MDAILGRPFEKGLCSRCGKQDMSDIVEEFTRIRQDFCGGRSVRVLEDKNGKGDA